MFESHCACSVASCWYARDLSEIKARFWKRAGNFDIYELCHTITPPTTLMHRHAHTFSLTYALSVPRCRPPSSLFTTFVSALSACISLPHLISLCLISPTLFPSALSLFLLPLYLSLHSLPHSLLSPNYPSLIPPHGSQSPTICLLPVRVLREFVPLPSQIQV